MRTLILSATLAAAFGVTACSPKPEPAPTPTAAFASAEEAFAAAEETYRAYNEAGNAFDSEAENSFLTGEALDANIDTIRYLKANKLRLMGTSQIVSFTPITAEIDAQVADLKADVCIDVSGSRVLNVDGTDVTPADRAPRWLLHLTFVGDEQELLIADSEVMDELTC